MIEIEIDPSDRRRDVTVVVSRVLQGVVDRIEAAAKAYAGCQHYTKRCQIIAPCCNGVAYPCRLCHDEAVTTHTLDRHAVTHVVCVPCGVRQPISNECVCCGEPFAEYYCKPCRMHDDRHAEKGTYHCDECGICRVGGRDNFFHCGRCGGCYTIVGREEHKCIDDRLLSECPVCLESMFASPCSGC